MITESEFHRIQDLQKIGLNKNQVSARMLMSYNTVARYWDMSQEEFEKSYERVHSGKNKLKAKPYLDEMLAILKEFPELSSTQIYNKLEKKYKEKLNISKRTVFFHVKRLREEYDIPKRVPQNT